jgi:hypothetical protein
MNINNDILKGIIQEKPQYNRITQGVPLNNIMHFNNNPILSNMDKTLGYQVNSHYNLNQSIPTSIAK